MTEVIIPTGLFAFLMAGIGFLAGIASCAVFMVIVGRD